MGVVTGTTHGDAAIELLSFYHEKANELEQAGQYFMAAISLAFALETAVLAYLLVEFGENNGEELRIDLLANDVRVGDSSPSTPLIASRDLYFE
jgi:hypothetical protein